MQGHLNALPLLYFANHNVFRYLMALNERLFVAIVTGRIANI